MKNSLRFLLASFSIALATATYGAGLPALDVMVANAAGKVAYKTKLGANGTFATPVLPPGDYTVQFNTRSAVPGNYELVLSAGKQKVLSGSVTGAQFDKGGVAMRVKVGQGLSITGQLITSGQVAAKGPGGAKVKIVNGKRFVWQGPETGSHMGGRWVEEGTPSNVIRGGAEALGAAQALGSQGAAPGR